MPVHKGQDKHGLYYQYGKIGAKYYYLPGSKRMRKMAKERALRQEDAFNTSRR